MKGGLLEAVKAVIERGQQVPADIFLSSSVDAEMERSIGCLHCCANNPQCLDDLLRSGIIDIIVSYFLQVPMGTAGLGSGSVSQQSPLSKKMSYEPYQQRFSSRSNFKGSSLDSLHVCANIFV